MVRFLRASFSLVAVLVCGFPFAARAQEPGRSDLDVAQLWEEEAADLQWSAPAAFLDPGSFRLDLTAGHRYRASLEDNEVQLALAPSQEREAHEFYALATLQVPLDHLLASSSPPADENGITSANQLDSAAELDAPSPSAGEAPLEATEASEQESSSDVVDEGPTDDSALLLLVSRELAEHVSAGFSGADSRLKSLVRRSRWSGLSPELRLRGVVGFDRTTSTEESVGIYPGDTTTRGARDSLAEVRMTFRLDRLVLGDGEDSLERQRIALAQERREIVAKAIDLFMEWRLAHLMSRDVSLPPDDLLKAKVTAEAALAQLHLLTGGWFEGEDTLRSLRAELADTAESD